MEGEKLYHIPSRNNSLLSFNDITDQFFPTALTDVVSEDSSVSEVRVAGPGDDSVSVET